MKLYLFLAVVCFCSVVATPAGKYGGGGGSTDNPLKTVQQNVTTGDTPAASDRSKDSDTPAADKSDDDSSKRNARNFLIQVGSPGLGLGFPFAPAPVAGPFFGGPSAVAPGFFNNPLRFWF